MKNIEYQIEEQQRTGSSRFTPQWRVKTNWLSKILNESNKHWFGFKQPIKGDGSEPGNKSFDNYNDALKVINEDFLNRKKYAEKRKDLDEYYNYKTIIHKIT